MATRKDASDHTCAEKELSKPCRARRRASTACRRSQKGKRRGPAEKRRSLNEKKRGLDDKRQGQDERRRGRDERKEGVTVKRTWSDGRRRWDKKHYCVFCRRPQVKIARHLLRKHAEQQEVKAASVLPTGSKQRHLLLEHLRCRGNYMHNIEVIRRGSGEIVPWRQPSEDVDARNYLPCPLCLGFFLRADLWKHQASCRRKLTSDPSTGSTSSAEMTSDCSTGSASRSEMTSDPSTGSASGAEMTSDLSKGSEPVPAGAQESPAEPTGEVTVPECVGQTEGSVTSDPSTGSASRAEMTSDPGAEQRRKRTRVQAAASRLLPISGGASESCSEVLHRMNQDAVSHQIKSDWLICKYGNKLLGNQECDQRRYDYVSQKLRELGRFLLAAKSLDPGVQTLQDLLAPPRLHLALTAARKASGNCWRRPPLALKTTLKTVCEIAMAESLQGGDWDAAAKTTDFYQQLGRDWDQLGQHTDNTGGGAKSRERLVQSGSRNQSTEPGPGPEALSVPVVPRKVRRRPWSPAEKEAVWRQLGVHVLVQSVPGKEVCQRCLDLEPDLHGRHWKDIKNQVHNQIQGHKKQQFHAQMDLQENQDQQDQIKSQENHQYHLQIHQQAQIHSQKNQERGQTQVDKQDQTQSQKNQQIYQPKMDQEEHIKSQSNKQNHQNPMDQKDQTQSQKNQLLLHAQMDQPEGDLQNKKKPQYHIQLDHGEQISLQNHKRPVCHVGLDHQDQIQKKHMYHMDQQSDLGTGSSYGPGGLYLLERENDMSPYDVQQRTPDQMQPRNQWMDTSLRQHYRSLEHGEGPADQVHF